MSEEFRVEKSNIPQVPQQGSGKVIDEANYNIMRTPQQSGPSAIGQGGDPLFKKINATSEQLYKLLEETASVQNWVHIETSNNTALSCLDNSNLKEAYYDIKDGFGEYGPVELMGFKTPHGVEIPRLKIMDKETGDVLQVLSGPMAMEEIAKRAMAYRESIGEYGEVDNIDAGAVIEDYSGNPNDYIS